MGTQSRQPEEGVLRTLRRLMPLRSLTPEEGRRIAELQANRLLAVSGVSGPAVPTEIVGELPRVQVFEDFDLPTSGSAHWDGANWVLTVKADEPLGRRRLSLLHEFKHVLDHPTRHLVEPDQAERLADYFAGCVLMPKRWVVARWCQGEQSVEKLAAAFAVTPRAMSVRLGQLGLTEPARRCSRIGATALSQRTSFRARYHRAISIAPRGALA